MHMIEKLFELAGLVKTAFAGGVIPAQTFALPDPFAGRDFSWVVGKIADFLIIIGAPLAAIMILIGGYYMVISGGDPEKFSTGRKTILYAAIGFAVILLAKGVATIIQGIFS